VGIDEYSGGSMALILQLEHLVHLPDGKTMMQKWQWRGKYVIPNFLDDRYYRICPIYVASF